MTTFTSITKNPVTTTSLTKSTSGDVLATAGLYCGFGCFNYSGGQTLVSGSLPVFTSINKNATTFTSLTKN